MSSLTESLVNKVAENCIDLYCRLPKTGKPNEKEWTVLSCFLIYNKKTDDIEVVSLGTGSKSIGSSKLSPNGDIMNDSHAEVFARRGFLIYLYDNIEKALKLESSIFVKVGNKFQLKDNIELIFYSSQLPCGDASIISKNEAVVNCGEVLQKKRKLMHDETEIDPKKQKVSEDIHRTGAKCLPHSTQDLKLPGAGFHILGQVRTKPGREFYQSSIQFPYIKADKRANATPGSILWVKLRNPILEVAILGKKLGVTKKKSNLLSSSLCISKHNLYKRFLGVLLKIEELKESVIGAEDVASIPYNVMKKKSENYVSKWLMVKDNFFKTWTTKPDFWNFCVDLT
ncbi:hypothetical protein O3G_MSEX003267 [Manduca sexta]|uniref:tRNA-specific adenosine deaminase 1 n=1 Tax=Manduca sexta TaxID=7130 RepID=A0A921YRP1_MANSE|nr:hypothetical protein O3G_MSEX003267 [Manduca sexta]